MVSSPQTFFIVSFFLKSIIKLVKVSNEDLRFKKNQHSTATTRVSLENQIDKVSVTSFIWLYIFMMLWQLADFFLHFVLSIKTCLEYGIYYQTATRKADSWNHKPPHIAIYLLFKITSKNSIMTVIDLNAICFV